MDIETKKKFINEVINLLITTGGGYLDKHENNLLGLPYNVLIDIIISSYLNAMLDMLSSLANKKPSLYPKIEELENGILNALKNSSFIESVWREGEH